MANKLLAIAICREGCTFQWQRRGSVEAYVRTRMSGHDLQSDTQCKTSSSPQLSKRKFSHDLYHAGRALTTGILIVISGVGLIQAAESGPVAGPQTSLIDRKIADNIYIQTVTSADGTVGPVVGLENLVQGQPPRRVYLVLGVDVDGKSTYESAQALSKALKVAVIPVRNRSGTELSDPLSDYARGQLGNLPMPPLGNVFERQQRRNEAMRDLGLSIFGFAEDVLHSIFDRFVPAADAIEPATRSLAKEIYTQLQAGNCADIVAHSQGTVIAQNAVLLTKRLLDDQMRDGLLTAAQRSALLMRIVVISAGEFAPASGWPQEVAVKHFNNDADIVATFGGHVPIFGKKDLLFHAHGFATSYVPEIAESGGVAPDPTSRRDVERQWFSPDLDGTQNVIALLGTEMSLAWPSFNDAIDRKAKDIIKAYYEEGKVAFYKAQADDWKSRSDLEKGKTARHGELLSRYELTLSEQRAAVEAYNKFLAEIKTPPTNEQNYDRLSDQWNKDLEQILVQHNIFLEHLNNRTKLITASHDLAEEFNSGRHPNAQRISALKGDLNRTRSAIVAQHEALDREAKSAVDAYNSWYAEQKRQADTLRAFAKNAIDTANAYRAQLAAAAQNEASAVEAYNSFVQARGGKIPDSEIDQVNALRNAALIPQQV